MPITSPTLQINDGDVNGGRVINIQKVTKKATVTKERVTGSR